jgi:chromosome segregation ATPase
MTDAANAEGDLSPTEIVEDAVEDSQQPQEGETSEATSEENKEEAQEPSSDENAETEAEVKEKTRNSVQQRISQLARQKNEANAKVQELEQQNQYLSAQINQAQQPLDKFPSLADHDYDETKYQQAVIEYNAKLNAQTVQQAMGQQSSAALQHLNAQKQIISEEQFKEKSKDFALDYPDYQEKVTSPTFAQSEFVASTIVNNFDNGPAVAYWLASNPQQAARVNQMNDMEAMKALTTISTVLSIAKRPVQTTNAPTPSKPVAPKGKVAKDLDKMTPEEYGRARGYRK